MGSVNDIVWIGCFIAAYLVKVSKRANSYIVFALIVYGLQSFLFSLANWGIINYSILDEFYQILALLPVFAIFLLVVGIFKLVRVGSPVETGNRVMQDAQGVKLETLFTPRNETNTYSRAEVLRDEACERMVKRAESEGLELIVQRSQAHSPTVWFRFDYLIPSSSPDLSLTASVVVDIERFDFHQYEHAFNVTVQVGVKTTKITSVMALDDATIDNIYKHILTPGRKLRLTNRLRQFPWQLWRPKNKVQRLRRDWFTIGLTVLAIALLMIPIFGVVLMAGIFVFLFFRARRRRTHVLTSGKPLNDPRSLRWMDSWQASIFGLGDSALDVQKGIVKRLKGGGPKGATMKVEKIGYWGTDSWVERKQIVVNHRRAIGFLHVQPYGEVLYVAWECHINSASWVEEKIVEGIDSKSGLDVVANRVVAGWHLLNEYDISDSNFLAEWMHDAVKREIKLRMAELKIDQEIDFTVQRESRTDAISAASEKKKPDKKPKTKKFKRLG
ncbi:MAG: hypothetical protein PVF86_01075 [Desulfobacterales bacterium]|jgi:hypothetical protein